MPGSNFEKHYPLDCLSGIAQPPDHLRLRRQPGHWPRFQPPQPLLPSLVQLVAPGQRRTQPHNGGFCFPVHLHQLSLFSIFPIFLLSLLSGPSFMEYDDLLVIPRNPQYQNSCRFLSAYFPVVSMTKINFHTYLFPSSPFVMREGKNMNLSSARVCGLALLLSEG